jgi:uncharacterized protein
MNLETLRRQREAILQIAAKHGASNLQVFGSVARQESTSDSDIDLLVDLEPERTLLDQIALIQDLEEFLGCPVDVVESDSLHDLIRDRIVKEAIPL